MSARCIEKIPPDVSPAKSQQDNHVLLGQALVSNVAVTHENDLRGSFRKPCKMSFGHIGATTRCHQVENDRGALHDPQVPVVSKLAVDFFEDLPAGLISMKEWLCHLLLKHCRHQGLKQRGQLLQ